MAYQQSVFNKALTVFGFIHLMISAVLSKLCILLQCLEALFVDSDEVYLPLERPFYLKVCITPE